MSIVFPIYQRLLQVLHFDQATIPKISLEFVHNDRRPVERMIYKESSTASELAYQPSYRIKQNIRPRQQMKVM